MSLTKTVDCFPRQTTLGTPNSMPDGVEDQFNWIGSPSTLPVLGREAIEGGQQIAVLGVAGDGLVLLGAIILEELIERFSTTALVSAIQMSCRCCLARGWTDFGSLLRRLAPRASS